MKLCKLLSSKVFSKHTLQSDIPFVLADSLRIFYFTFLQETYELLGLTTYFLCW